jgi:septum site-determining protein MinD
MTRFITIASGKGGTGKTTTAVNLGVCLRNLGLDVTIVDASMTPNLSLHLGVPKLPVTLNDVLKGNQNIYQATYLHASGIKIIPASINLEEIKETDYTQLKEIFKQLQGTSEVVIVDSAAGINKETLATFDHQDEVLIVTNPEIAAVTDALKTIKLAEEKGTTVIGIILNKIKNDDTELSIKEIETILGMPIIAEIPYSQDIRKAQKNKHPAVYLYPNSHATASFKKLAAKLIGQDYETPMNLPKKGFWYFTGKILGFK